MLITFRGYGSKKHNKNVEEKPRNQSTNMAVSKHNCSKRMDSATTCSKQSENKLVTASSQLSVYGTAHNQPVGRTKNCNSSESSVTCSTQDQVSSISQTNSMCNLQTSLTTDDSQSISSSQSNSSSNSGTESPGKSTNGSSTSTHQPITNLTLPLFKKDGRTWLHKTSAIAKYGAENLIGQKFKKDSRIWLHKSSKKRRLFTISCDILCEVELEPEVHQANTPISAGDNTPCPTPEKNLPVSPQDVSTAELFSSDETKHSDQPSPFSLQLINSFK